MKKTFVCLLIAILLLSAGCGSTTTVEFNENIEESSTKDIPTETKTEVVSEEKNDVSDDIAENTETVSVILTMISFNDTETIDDYVSKQNTANNSNSYAVYDDTHYTLTITEAERLEMLSQYDSGALIEESFSEIFSDEQYNDAFIKMDYDELFQNITFYADADKYNSAGIAGILGPTLISSFYSDIIQAYNLIPVNERVCIIKILDNETNAILYDSSTNG